MPPIPARGGILVLLFLCVNASVTLCIRSRTVRDRILNGISMKISGPVFFFFSVGLVIAELCPFFEFCIVNLWNLVNKISGEPLELGSWIAGHGVDDKSNFVKILYIFS